MFFLWCLPLVFAGERVSIYQVDMSDRNPTVHASIDAKVKGYFADHPEDFNETIYGGLYRVPFNFPIESKNGSQVINYIDISLGPWAPNFIFYYSYHLKGADEQLHDLREIFDKVQLSKYVPKSVIDEALSSPDGEKKYELPVLDNPYSLSCLGDVLDKLSAARGGKLDVKTTDFLHLLAEEAPKLGLLPVVHSDQGDDISTMMLLRMHGHVFYEEVLAGNVSLTSPEVVAWAREVDRAHKANVFRNVEPSQYHPISMSGKAACAYFPVGLSHLYFPSGNHPFVDVPFPVSPQGMEVAKCGYDCPLDVIGEEVVVQFPRSQPIEEAEEFVEWFVKNTYEKITPTTTFAEWMSWGPFVGSFRPELVPSTPEFAPLREAIAAQNKYGLNLHSASYTTKSVMADSLAKILHSMFKQDENGNPTRVKGLEEELSRLEVDRLTLLFRRTSPVQFSIPPGVYKKNSIVVELTCGTPGASILYTTDGADPTIRGVPYSGPITIHSRGETLIWAVAKGKDLLISDPTTGIFAIDKINLTLVLAVAIPCAMIFIAALVSAIMFLKKRRTAGAEDHMIPSSELDLQEIIGAGSTSIVYRAVLRESLDVAVKVRGSIADDHKTNFSTAASVHKSRISVGSDNNVTPMKASNVKRVSSANMSSTQFVSGTLSDATIPGMVTSSLPSTSSPMPEARPSLMGRSPIIGVHQVQSDHRYTVTSAQGPALNSMASTASSGARLLTPVAGGGKRTQKKFSKAFSKELIILATLRHPNILLLYGFTPATASHGPGMVLEYMSQGSLFNVLGNTSVTLGAKRKLEMAMDIAKGMSFLANLKPAMVHRDFKSLNILVDGHGTCKVSDFESATTEPEKAAPTMGSIPWTAPEVLSSKGQAHSLASDMYSFGVVLWEIGTRREPYHGFSVNEIRAAVLEGKRPDSAGAIERPITGLPEGYAELVSRCWSQNPADRPTIAEVTRLLAEMYAKVASEVTVEASNGTRAIAFASQLAPANLFKEQHLSFLMTGRADALPLPATTCAVFTDIVGFTQLSETLEPVAVADLLMELFKKFDSICEPLGGVLYKTMGDAYILLVSEESVAAVGGTEPPALVGTRIALRLTQAAETVDAKGTPLKIRAGVNVGPAALQIMSLDVVEVIGDMMNVAARMEQTSIPGKVQVTEAVHAACRDSIVFSNKATVQVKGKGQLSTMFVLAERT